MGGIANILAKAAAYVLLIGMFFGAFVVIAVPFEMTRMVSAESWPARKAIVTTSYANRTSSTRHATFWRPEICGSYKDNGERFCVSRVSFGSFRFGSGEAEARATVAKYHEGLELNVYYSPDNSKETILDPHPSWNAMVTLLALGAGFLAIPVVLWLFRKRERPGTT
jgi:uncharacterized protein DUF3592